MDMFLTYSLFNISIEVVEIDGYDFTLKKNI